MGGGCMKLPKERKEDLQARPSSEETNKHDSVAPESTKTGTNVTTEPGTYKNETTEPVSEIISPNQVKPNITETTDSQKANANDTNEPETNNAAKISQASPSGELPMTMDSAKTCTNGTNKPEENNIDTIEQTPTTDATGSEQDNPQLTVTMDSTETCTNGTNKPEDNVRTIDKTPTTDATGSEQDNSEQTVTMDSTETCTNGTTKPEENNIDTIEKTPTTDATGSEQDNPQLTVTVDLTNTCANGSNEPKENHIETVEQTPTLQATGSEQDSQQLTSSSARKTGLEDATQPSNAQGSSQSSPTAGHARSHSDSLGSESSKHATSEKLQEPPQPSQNVDKQLEKANQEIIKLRFALEEKTREVENLQSEQKQPTVKKDMKKLKDKELREQYQRALNEKERLEEKLKKEKKEKEEVLLRLSAEAATKLTHNNPQVTDLSDENRATKLSEKFSELYDNQWTDAFEALVKDSKYSDRDAIDILLRALLKISDKCVEKSKQDMQKLKDIISEFGGDDKDGVVSKGLLERRKHRFGHTLQELTESIKEKLDADGKVVFTACPTYIENCIKLCWLMAIQDPPLHIGRSDVQKNERFDKGLFKSYTVDGDEIDYVVWPALFLHLDGPLLCKGVAQAKGKDVVSKTKTKENMTPITAEAEVPSLEVSEITDTKAPDESPTKMEENEIKNQNFITIDKSYDKNNQTPDQSAQFDGGCELESKGQSMKNVDQTEEEADEPQTSLPTTLANEEQHNLLIVDNLGANQNLVSELQDEDNQVQEQVEQTTTNKQNDAIEEQSKTSAVQIQVAEVREVDDVCDTGDLKTSVSEQAAETATEVDKVALTTDTQSVEDNKTPVATENSNKITNSKKENEENTEHSASHFDVSEDEPLNPEYELSKTEFSTTSQQSIISSSKHENEHQKQSVSSSNNDNENTDVRTDFQMKTVKSTVYNSNSGIPNKEISPRAFSSEPTRKTTKRKNDNDSEDVSVQNTKLELDKAGEENTNKQTNISQDFSQNSPPKITSTATQKGKLSADEREDRTVNKPERSVSSKKSDVNKTGTGEGGEDNKNKVPTVSTTKRNIVDYEGKPIIINDTSSSCGSTKSVSNRSSTNSIDLESPVTSTRSSTSGRSHVRTASAGKVQGFKVETVQKPKQLEVVPRGAVKEKLAIFSRK